MIKEFADIHLSGLARARICAKKEPQLNIIYPQNTAFSLAFRHELAFYYSGNKSSIIRRLFYFLASAGCRLDPFQHISHHYLAIK